MSHLIICAFRDSLLVKISHVMASQTESTHIPYLFDMRGLEWVYFLYYEESWAMTQTTRNLTYGSSLMGNKINISNAS